MASYNNVTFNGSTSTISVPFAYLDKSHVHLYLDSVEQTSGFVWTSSGLITLSSPPASGVKGEVKRITPFTPITHFVSGNLDVTDLNVASQQPLFLAEEAADLSTLTADLAAIISAGLGGAAALNVGTTAGTVAAGNDTRIVSALQPGASADQLVSGTANKVYTVAEQTKLGALPAAAALQSSLDAKLALLGGNMLGSLILKGFGGTTGFITGDADAASYAHNNVLFKVHNGLGISTYDDSVHAFLDARQGIWDVKGDFRRDGVSILPSALQRVSINGIPILLSSDPSQRTANTSLLNAAIAAASGSVLVVFDRGYFPLDRIAKLQNRNVLFLGQGGHLSELNFAANDGHSIWITQNDLSYTNHIKGLYITKANGLSSYKAIYVERPVAASGAGYEGPIIGGNIIFGQDTGDWAGLIHVKEGWLFNISNNILAGASSLANKAVTLEGHSTDGIMVGNQGAGLDIGVFAPSGSFSEGAVIMANKFVQVNWGIYLDNGGNAPGAHVDNNHIAAFKGGVYAYARPQLHITKNLIYMNMGAIVNFRGVYVGFAPVSRIDQNIIIGFEASKVAQGIVVDQSTEVDCSMNKMQNIYTMIDYLDTSTGAITLNTGTGYTNSYNGRSGVYTLLGNHPVS